MQTYTNIFEIFNETISSAVKIEHVYLFSDYPLIYQSYMFILFQFVVPANAMYFRAILA